MMIQILRMAVALAAIVFWTNAHAAGWLIISKATEIRPGQPLVLEVIRPEGADWPQSLQLHLSDAITSEQIALQQSEAEALPDHNTHRRSYHALAVKHYKGVVTASLDGLPSNRFLLMAAGEIDAGQQEEAAYCEPCPLPENNAPTIVLAQPGDQPALAAHEASYFLVGNTSDRDTDARFQISFKYRLFDPEGIFGRYSPLLSNLYFTYTQTSLWDLGEDSSPFRDTSYRPGLFYEWAGSGRQLMPDEWRIGLEHESNGRSEEDSRSIDIAYLKPVWHLDFANGKRLSLMPKIYHYLDKSDNRDIQRYRGYVDWIARYGREDGLVIEGLYRQGTAGYATGQIDLSYPISEKIFARTGSFVHLQLFSGYGETLLEYDRKRDSQIRLGISLSR